MHSLKMSSDSAAGNLYVFKGKHQLDVDVLSDSASLLSVTAFSRLFIDMIRLRVNVIFTAGAFDIVL